MVPEDWQFEIYDELKHQSLMREWYQHPRRDFRRHKDCGSIERFKRGYKHTFHWPSWPLPPLGVLAYYQNSPVAALWCFEAYGAPVGWFEMALTNPTNSLSLSRDGLLKCVECLQQLAGSACDPPAQYKYFHANAHPVMHRTLEKLGWINTGGTQYTKINF